MLNLLVSLGWGTLSFTKEKAENIVEEMVNRGDLRREEAKKVLKELIDRGEKERKELKEYLHTEFSNWMHNYQLVSREEFDKLAERVKDLEEELDKKDT